ncbi:MAG: hypothetical protein Q8K45_07460 [Rubrivivax sp.]|nr:hypothetical protein [Rubrivivax sp.]
MLRLPRRTWLLATAGGLFVRRGQAQPLPPAPFWALAGETHVLDGQFIYEQVAPPVMLGDGSALLFNLDVGRGLALWQVYPLQPERSRRTPRPDLVLDTVTTAGGGVRRARLGSALTAAGVWLAGGVSVRLLRPDGGVLTLALREPRDGITVLALPDGAVLLLGGQGWPQPALDRRASVRVERVALDAAGTALRAEPLPDLPVDVSGSADFASFFGWSAVHLGEGRVLVAGGPRKLSLLWTPGAAAWQVLPGLVTARLDPALARLPDGRVWASGGGGGAAQTEAASSSELWDPASQRWQPGPALPVPMQGHQAVPSADGRRVLLAGGKHSPVLAWVPGAARVTVAAQPGLPRRSAALVPLTGDRLALVSGIVSRSYAEAYGRRSPGASIVALAPGDTRAATALWPMLEQAGVARRGDRVVAVGGRWRSAYLGSEEQLAGCGAELHDLGSGQVTTLPPMPVPTAQAQLCWLDERRLLVAATRYVDSGFAAWLGVLDLAGGWRVLDVAPLRGRFQPGSSTPGVQLAGFDGRVAWLLHGRALLPLDPVSGHIGPPVPLMRWREDAVMRVLADGRVLLAGGHAQAERVASHPADCPDSDDCPVQYLGWGTMEPARGHEIYLPSLGRWQHSALSEGAAFTAAVLADGRVAQAGAAVDSERVLLEISDAAGQQWRALPWPVGTAIPRSTHNGGNTLRLFAAEQSLFLRAMLGDTARWWWMNLAREPVAWQPMAGGPSPYELPPGGLPLGQTDAQGRPLFASGGLSGLFVHTR